MIKTISKRKAMRLCKLITQYCCQNSHSSVSHISFPPKFNRTHRNIISTIVVENIALKKLTYQSSTRENDYSSRAVDGNTDNVYGHGSCTGTRVEPSMWWMVDFGQSAIVHAINITNRGRLDENEMIEISYLAHIDINCF